ncbi:TPA: hypothetical protein QFV83_004630 [Klebsiella aerogenes]|nr:hypothetical protein [Klebsiella aerogenes]
MDTWEWYHQYSKELREAGQGYIPQIIDDFSDSVLHVQLEKSDALLPEMKALNQAAKNPWLEIFIGHWEMRHRLTNYGEGEKVLPDIVALFEKAHREEAIDCPQSVCVTQDLSACYENIDGPGWASERMAVCEETMSRIDPTWSCFQCLSTEYASALMDSQQYEQALAYLDKQIAAVQASGEDDIEALLCTRIDILILLQRYDEAKALVEPLAEENDYWGRDRISYQLKKLYIMALTGQDDEVWAQLPSWSQITPYSWEQWLRIITALLPRYPERNTWALARIIQQVMEQRSQVGAHRKVVELAKLQINLALERESIWVARLAFKLAQRHIPKLRALLGVDLEFLALSEKIASREAELLARPAMVTTEESEQPDPEKDVEIYRLRYLQSPDDAQLLDNLCAALTACYARDEAIEYLSRYVARHLQDDDTLCFRLLDLLAEKDDLAAIEQLARQYEEAGIGHMALWFRCRILSQQEDWNALEALGQQLMQHTVSKEWPGVYRLNALAAQKQLAFDRQLGYLQQLLELQTQREMDINNTLWDIMSVASILQRWDVVREIAGKLEMKLTPGDGFIEEDWGIVRLHFRENYESHYYYARRTGPVTARVIQPAYRTNLPQHADEVVVFDAELMNTPPEDEQERENFIPLYNVVHSAIPTSYGESWFCDGARPQEDQLEAFREALHERQWYYWCNSPDDYEIIDSHQEDDGKTLAGFYFVISAPQSVSKTEIDKTLSQLTADWQHPLCWLGLAQAAGGDEDKHRAIIERYGL